MRRQVYILPALVHWRIERDIVERAPIMMAAYRNTTLVPPHILFPILERHIDDIAKRTFLGKIIDGAYMSILNQN